MLVMLVDKNSMEKWDEVLAKPSNIGCEYLEQILGINGFQILGSNIRI